MPKKLTKANKGEVKMSIEYKFDVMQAKAMREFAKKLKEEADKKDVLSSDTRIKK